MKITNAMRVRVAAVAALILVALLGQYHVVWGSVDRLHLEPKISWSLRETFINTDEITGVPSDAQRALRWPLYFESLKAAQRHRR